MIASKKVALGLAVFMMTIFVFVGCSEAKPVGNKDMDVSSGKESETVSPEIETPVPEEDDTPEKEPEADTKNPTGVYTTGNLSFAYADDLTIKEIEDLPYFYYNDSSFFYAESLPMDADGEEIDEQFVFEYFDSAAKSFSQGSWQSGVVTADPQMGQFNGLNIWIGEVAMQRDGIPFMSSTALVYHDGILTNLTLISDADSYQINAPDYAKTIASITPAV